MGAQVLIVCYLVSRPLVSRSSVPGPSRTRHPAVVFTSSAGAAGSQSSTLDPMVWQG